jgi:medium-chain acyl-[acyl-carrier-protein] hydrolase
MPSESSLWFARPPARDPADVRLLAIPPAGSSAAFFNDWRPYLPDWLELIGLRLPGRESRFLEPAFDDMSELVRALETVTASDIAGPYAILGHCGGAFVAFELARLASGGPGDRPVKLILIGQPPPHTLTAPPVPHDLPFDDLLTWLVKSGGTPEVVISNPPLLEVLEPSIRADLRVLESYRYAAGQPLALPVAVIGATGDPDLPPETLSGWGDLTAGRFALHMFDSCDHLLSDRVAEICATIADELEQFRAHP